LYKVATLLAIRSTFRFSQGGAVAFLDPTRNVTMHKVVVTADIVTAPIIGRWRTSSVALEHRIPCTCVPAGYLVQGNFVRFTYPMSGYSIQSQYKNVHYKNLGNCKIAHTMHNCNVVHNSRLTWEIDIALNMFFISRINGCSYFNRAARVPITQRYFIACAIITTIMT